MTLTLPALMTSRATWTSTVCVLLAGCGSDMIESRTATVTLAADGGSAGPTGALVPCGQPVAPPNGTVHTARLGAASIATYACASDFDLVGEAVRACQSDGSWSGSAPTCLFVRAGTPCGGCGGSYLDDGTCSIATPANLGVVCDVGSGKGACASGGTITCDGACQAAHPAMGEATAWHLEPAPTGSWDWDCDGVVTRSLHRSPVPPECATFADLESCEASAAVEYISEDAPCGQQAMLFLRDCDWKTLGPTCLNTPASHRVVFQQCR